MQRQRDEVFVEYTKSICPVCKIVLDAEVNIREQKVFLRRRCPDHGMFEALVYADADAYVSSARFNKPGNIPLQFQTEIRDGCPSDCGLCPQHKQHACLAIIEVNTNCNLDCPICFADSGHQPDGYAITHEQCARMLDTFVAAEGEPEVVMLSGGEPTIHKHILDFIDLALARPIRNVTLNTNGIRLASDRRFVAALGERNGTDGKSVNIYLQFDGLDRETHLRIRNRDLREIKQRALDNCAEAGVSVTLAAAIERGVNEHEVGPIVQYGLAHPAVRAVVFQPVTHSGRHLQFDPRQRLTNPDVMRALADQLGWLRADDFFPVPCCFPTCRSITYLITDGTPGEPDFTAVPIPRLVQVEDYLDYVTNRVLPDSGVREALEKLWSASAFMDTATTNEKLAKTAEVFDCGPGGCGINLPQAVQELTDRAFMIVVQDFQDPYTLNVKQLMKCCVEELTPDGRIIPFCAYNSVGYREQIRAQLTGVPVPDMVPNAADLLPLLADSPHGSKMTATTPTAAGIGLLAGAPRATHHTNTGRRAVRP